jgi:hypothetical protein
MVATDLRGLNGKVVLVRSARDHRDPPTAMRGTIEVGEEQGGTRVRIVLDFPQMFTTRAHRRTVTLDEEAIAQLVASEHAGTYAVTLPDRLDPAAPAGNE